MISTSDTTGVGNPSPSSNEHRHFPTTTTKAKDDTCTQTRVRHPTDRGYDPSAAPLSPTMFGSGNRFFFDNSESSRTRAHTYSTNANAKPYMGRMNVYKRPEGPVSPSTKESESNGSPAKQRETWLQKGSKATAQAAVHRPIQPAKQGSPTPAADQQPQTESANRKSPIVVGASGTARPITGFLDRLRPRSNSDATGVLAAQQALISRRRIDGGGGGSKASSGASSTNQSRKSSGICVDDDEGIGMGQYSPAIVLVCGFWMLRLGWGMGGQVLGFRDIQPACTVFSCRHKSNACTHKERR